MIGMTSRQSKNLFILSFGKARLMKEAATLTSRLGTGLTLSLKADKLWTNVALSKKLSTTLGRLE